jgi:hypothetical protein
MHIKHVNGELYIIQGMLFIYLEEQLQGEVDTCQFVTKSNPRCYSRRSALTLGFLSLLLLFINLGFGLKGINRGDNSLSKGMIGR